MILSQFGTIVNCRECGNCKIIICDGSNVARCLTVCQFNLPKLLFGPFEKNFPQRSTFAGGVITAKEFRGRRRRRLPLRLREQDRTRGGGGGRERTAEKRAGYCPSNKRGDKKKMRHGARGQEQESDRPVRPCRVAKWSFNIGWCYIMETIFVAVRRQRTQKSSWMKGKKN